MYTLQKVLAVAQQLSEGESARFRNFGENKAYTILVKRHGIEEYAVKLLRQKRIQGENDKNRNIPICIYKKLPAEMLPYILGKIIAYDFAISIKERSLKNEYI